MSIEKQLDSLKKIIDVQCSDGNWNYDSYMHGLANGLILAKAIIENTDPEYLDAPSDWGCDTDEGFVYVEEAPIRTH